jgi:hypothetical protein
MTKLADVVETTAIRPFQVNVPEAELTELRRRINATRWPEKEPVADHSQGVPLATMQKLARYWATEYDWRKVEARVSALPLSIPRLELWILRPLILARPEIVDRDERQLVAARQLTCVRPVTEIEDEVRSLRSTSDTGTTDAGEIL